MAKCEKREINPVAPPVEYVLTLTADEARYLWYRLNNDANTRSGYVGPGVAYEMHTDLWEALDRAGVRRV